MSLHTQDQKQTATIHRIQRTSVVAHNGYTIEGTKYHRIQLRIRAHHSASKTLKSRRELGKIYR